MSEWQKILDEFARVYSQDATCGNLFIFRRPWKCSDWQEADRLFFAFCDRWNPHYPNMATSYACSPTKGHIKLPDGTLQHVAFYHPVEANIVEGTDSDGGHHVRITHLTEDSWKRFASVARLAACKMKPELFRVAGLSPVDVGNVGDWMAYCAQTLQGTDHVGILFETECINPLKASIAAIKRLIDEDARSPKGGEAANPPATGDAQPEASVTPAEKKPGKLPKLRPHAAEAWRLNKLAGIRQTEVAELLNREHGTTYCQGTVSNLVANAQKYADAGGVMPIIPKQKARVHYVDPSRTELGARTTRSKARPSDLNRED